MATTITRRRISFNLPVYMLDQFKETAKKEKVSMNSLVENYLMDFVYREPNEVTLAAMKEAEDNDNLEPIDVYHFKEYVKAL